MSPAPAAMLTMVIVLIGRWSQKKPLDVRVVVGGTVLLLMLATMNETSPKLAKQFSLLIMLAALFTYGTDIFTKLPTKPNSQYLKTYPNKNGYGRQ